MGHKVHTHIYLYDYMEAAAREIVGKQWPAEVSRGHLQNRVNDGEIIAEAVAALAHD